APARPPAPPRASCPRCRSTPPQNDASEAVEPDDDSEKETDGQPGRTGAEVPIDEPPEEPQPEQRPHHGIGRVHVGSGLFQRSPEEPAQARRHVFAVQGFLRRLPPFPLPFFVLPLPSC